MITHRYTLVPVLKKLKRGSLIEIQHISSNHQNIRCATPNICSKDSHFLQKTLGVIASIYSTSFSSLALDVFIEKFKTETFYLDEDYIVNIKILNKGEK